MAPCRIGPKLAQYLLFIWGCTTGINTLPNVICYLDLSLVSSLSKFADDTKTLRKVPEVEYAFTFQEDLHSMYSYINGVRIGSYYSISLNANACILDTT